MREIRFRCWHNLAKPIWNEKHTRVVAYEAGMIYDEMPGDCLAWKNAGQDIDCIEQFTGLHDSKGAEIFEGDVVSGTVSMLVGYDAPTGAEAMEDFPFESPITFKDGAFQAFIAPYDSSLSLDEITAHGIEMTVIGNIHQPPFEGREEGA